MMKTFAKSALCGLYKYSGLLSVQERMRRWTGQPFLAVLLFHRVTDAIPADGLTVGTVYFREMCRLLQRNFRVVSLGEIFRIVQSGEKPPPRTVAITFDDCYRDNLFAARVMAEYQLPGCFFLPTAYVGTDHVFDWDKELPRMANLSWEDAHEMLALGHEIGSHTVTHADMAQVSLEQARQELEASKKSLEVRLNRPVRWFAYPYGAKANFLPERLPLVYETGYEGIVSGYGGFIFPGMAGQILPRIPVPCFPSLLNLELHLTGCLEWWYGMKRKLVQQ